MKTYYQKSAEAQAIELFLETAEIGQVITYSDISDAAGVDVTSSAHRGKLRTARESLQNGQQMLFGCVKGIGLKRLDDAQIVGAGASMIRTMSRQATRAARALACADFASLSDADKIKHNVSMSIAGAVRISTSEASRVSLERKVLSNGGKIDIHSTMQFFLGKLDEQK